MGRRSDLGDSVAEQRIARLRGQTEGGHECCSLVKDGQLFMLRAVMTSRGETYCLHCAAPVHGV